MSSEATTHTNGYPDSIGVPSTLDASSNSDDTTEQPSKQAIGWMFAQQYYSTLSKSPDRLHLYYSKRSQLVTGVEAEKTPVCVGMKAIAERIKELDFADAKVLVTNVDAQESGRDIVIQTIGELSLRGQPPRKFVQTFVLAEQPNGYFALNDIFRYINFDNDEEVADQPTVADGGPVEEPAAIENSEPEKEIETLEKKLEETVAEPEIEPSAVAAIGNEVEEPTQADAAESIANDKPTTPEAAAQQVEEELQQTVEEKPKDPEPTPAPASPVKSAAEPAITPASVPAPSKSAAPKTWASMLSSGNKTVAVPQVPNSAPTQPKTASKTTIAPAATQSSEAVSAPGAVITAAGLTDDTQVPPSPGGWQTAGQDNHRKQHRQQPSSLGGQHDGVSAYIKNVTDKVDASLLRQTLTKCGKLTYFDVSRAKNCAFVEFETPAGFQQAISANPYILNGVEVIVAERHRAGAAFPRGGGARGGRGGMENRTNSQNGRGGSNKEGRGNFANRGARGGVPAQRGRGQAA